MVSIREFSELLSSIRSTATDPSGWEVALDNLSRLTNARTALIIKRSPSFTLHRISAIGGTHTKSERLLLYPRSKKEYAEYYGSRDPFPLALRRSKLTGIVPGEALIPTSLLRRSDLYHAMLVPNELEHMCLASLTGNSSSHYQLAIWRDQSRGPFLPEDCEWLNLLIPHFGTAISLHNETRRQEAKAAYADVLLESMESAAFLLDSRLRLVQINGPAEDLLRQGEIISRGNTIELSNRHDHARFRDLLANVSQKRAAEHSSSGGRLSFFCSKPEPHTAHALVAPVMVKFTYQESAMHILVLIKTVRKDRKSLPAVLNHLWGCTEAEAAVAIMLMGDHTPDEIANVRKVSVGTVRNQIKSLLSKTNTRRQSEFVHLLFQLPSEIRPPVFQMGQAFHANPGDSHF